MDTRRFLTNPAWRGPAVTAVVAVVALAIGGCAVLPVPDPASRTLGTYIDDEQLESRAKREILLAHPDLKDAHIITMSYEGRLLLAGEVSSEAAREAAEATASKLRQVRTVYNELRVAGPTTFLARRNDSWLTNKVDAKMLVTKDFESSHVKVVTVDGTVYLIGRVSRAEGEQAASITQGVYGVERIVKLFEYID